MSTYSVSKPVYSLSSHDIQPPVGGHNEVPSTATHSPVHMTDKATPMVTTMNSFSDSELIGQKNESVQSSAVTKEMSTGQEGDTITVQALAVLSSVSQHVMFYQPFLKAKPM